jgi:hypothetical protein
MDLILGKHETYESSKRELGKPSHAQPERLIDFYKRALLALSYSYGNHENPIRRLPRSVLNAVDNPSAGT